MKRILLKVCGFIGNKFVVNSLIKIIRYLNERDFFIVMKSFKFEGKIF